MIFAFIAITYVLGAIVMFAIGSRPADGRKVVKRKLAFACAAWPGVLAFVIVTSLITVVMWSFGGSKKSVGDREE